MSSKMSYKRPTPRPVSCGPKHFVSVVQAGGGVLSQWCSDESPALIVSGTAGRVGEIVDKMRNPCARHPAPTRWAPPSDYEFAASHLPASERAVYLARCSDWFDSHVRREPVVRRAAPLINPGPVLKVFAKWTPKCPPVNELEKAWRSAGYTEERIQKALRTHARLEATSDDRQKVLDAIFARWPAASKPTPKPRTKVIKAVKKKL